MLVESWEQCRDAQVLLESPYAMAGVHIAEALSKSQYASCDLSDSTWLCHRYSLFPSLHNALDKVSPPFRPRNFSTGVNTVPCQNHSIPPPIHQSTRRDT